ncbi:MAG TPA: nucleotide sugar dehydrogenase [Candidatus Nanoarchaeia archaeon]|nr:nucleotide sugar dehydrogenase [Candidatus Nanoarchaeia archaeon]
MERKIAVVGLGYVGLPLALALSEHFKVVGFDINKEKISSLSNGIDKTKEYDVSKTNGNLTFTSDEKELSRANFIIIAVPTPITEANNPDLTCLERSSEIVGRNLQKNSIVVYESTVYPGVTEEICLPILEKTSGLKVIQDFKIGYSPERINPGDKEHTIDKVVKVVSGIDQEALEEISKVYGEVAKAGIFKARNIKTAEAAKVIENIQRDLNIALMNELSLIFDKVGIKTKDVLAAASTKWNFHKYHPGLVGGHCIGVDPYYLTHKAQLLGYNPAVILAGRSVNNFMPKHVANLVIKGLNEGNRVLKNSKVLIMGLTFKEDVTDSRGSKAKDLIDALKEYNIKVLGCEPNLSTEEVEKIFGIKNYKLDEIKDNIDCIVLVNKHKQFYSLTMSKLKKIMNKNSVIVDVKNFFNEEEAKRNNVLYYSL